MADTMNTFRLGRCGAYELWSRNHDALISKHLLHHVKGWSSGMRVWGQIQETENLPFLNLHVNASSRKRRQLSTWHGPYRKTHTWHQTGREGLGSPKTLNKTRMLHAPLPLNIKLKLLVTAIRQKQIKGIETQKEKQKSTLTEEMSHV